MERESFKSRLGFILVSAGCAIGIGNVWKFPYVAGQNGGGIFLLFYLLFLALMGIPVLTMELSLGRGSGKSIVKAYKKLEPKGSKWHIHGWVAVAGCYLLMMYYTTVSGWMIDYCCKFATGQFSGVKGEGVDTMFLQMLDDPAEMLLFLALTIVLGFLVCSGGLKNGVERITKVMMLLLLGLIVVLVVNSMTLSGAGEGLYFFLFPNVERANDIGWWNVISAAMTQAFFTLSLGVGSMEIFGSYMARDNTLGSESIRICGLDTFVAIASGLIIFPACFSFGVEPTEGPSLIFVTLPKIFIHMPYGRVWGTMFFLFMSFASFSTVTAVFENLISSSMDNWNWSRKKATVINGVFMLVASLPCMLGFNLLKDISLNGKNILDFEDFIVSYLLLPVGALVMTVFCSTKFGWGFENYRKETNTGKGIRFGKGMRHYFRFVLPVLILIILVSGLIANVPSFFG